MKITRNRVIGLGVAIVSALALALTGCSGNADGGGGGSTDSFVVGYAGAIQANPNNKAIEDSMRNAVENFGGDLIVTDANLDPSKQLSDVQSLINQKIDVLVIWPLDPNGIQPAIQQADDAGIPVLVQDTTDGGPYASNFQVTNFESAKEAATLIEEAVGPKANVAQIEGLPIVGVLDARNRGFKEGAAELGQTILASQVNETDGADGARAIVDAWKARFGSEIQAVFAYNDPSAIGVASAKSPEFDPVVIGMNGDADGIKAVEDGRLLATFDFHPVQVGYSLGWGAHELATGKKLPATVTLEATMIDKSNVDEWVPVKDLLKKKFDVSIKGEGDSAKLIVKTVN